MNGVEGAAIIRVFRCACGKMHCCAGIGPISTCSCGRRLWLPMWRGGR